MTEQIIIGMPEVKVKELKPEFGRFMLIACDGIWNSISRNNAAIVVSEFIKSPTVKMSEICQHVSTDRISSIGPTITIVFLPLTIKPTYSLQLIERCLAPTKTACNGRGLDNMTCVLIRFKNPPVDLCADAMNSLKLNDCSGTDRKSLELTI